MDWFDAHCHLQHDALFPMLGPVTERARTAGVSRMVCCGTSPADWSRVLRCAEQVDAVLPMIGIHPEFVSEAGSGGIQVLETLLRENPQTGIGETGLDFRRRFSLHRPEQEILFAAHLDLARELNRPVAVHCVGAWGRLIEILQDHPAPRILLHAYSGSDELIPQLAELNCRFSFGGAITNERAKKARRAVVSVPEELLLLETDAPDALPHGAAPADANEPANLIDTARIMAHLRKCAMEHLAEITFRNADRFFKAL
jgi:TatD DNase family protein